MILACTVPVKTPCLPRPDAWFREHMKQLIRDADAVQAVQAPDYQELPYLMRGVVAARVCVAYQAAAASGALKVLVLDTDKCSCAECPTNLYRRAVVLAIRQAVAKEEDRKQWPSDF